MPFLVLLFLFIASTTFAEDETVQSMDKIQEKIEAPENPKNTFFDKTHRSVSRTILGVADGIDTFFAKERISSEGKKSQLKISSVSTVVERGGFEHQLNIKARLRLPKTQKSLNLVVDSIRDSFDKDEVKQNELDAAQQAVDSDDLIAALRLNLRNDRKWDLSTDAGVKIRFPLDPFLSARARRSFDVWFFELRLTERIFWFHTSGLGQISRADFDYPFGGVFLFRIANSATWNDSDSIWRFNHSLSLFHTLSDKAAMAYSIGMNTNNDPDLHIESYSLSVSYRRNIWRDWLFFEVTPGISFPLENDFNAISSIAFRLESVFGEF